MPLLTDIVRETAESFGLGNKAGALIAETIRIMFNPKLGGLKGFLDGFERAGLGELAHSWREAGVLKPLDGKQLEGVVGTDVITEAGRNLGLANARVRTAMAFVVPRLTRFFATGTDLPRTLPPAVEAFLASDEARIVAPTRRPLPRQKPQPSRSGFWTIGVLVLLVTGGLMGYQLWKNQQKLKEMMANPQPIAAVETPQQQKPEPEPETGKPPARLVIRNDAGQFEFSGVVGDAGIRTNVVEQLLTFFGQPRLSGSLAIDPMVAVPGWLSRLDRVLPQLNVPGLDVRLEGNQVRLGGWLSEQDRESVMNSLKTALGPGYRFSYLRDEETELTEESQQQTLAALAALPPGYQSQDLLAILNRWVIPFAEGGAEFPEEGKVVLSRAAELLKGMAQPVIIEIGGHTDNLGKPADNLRQSQARAAAVREALVQAGVPVQMMQFKAYGSEQPVASNDTPYGRFKNRRIEFKAVQPCDAAHPCGLPDPAAIPPVESLGPVMLEKEEPPLPALPGSASTLAPEPAKAVTEPVRRPKPKAKPSPSKADSGDADSPSGATAGAGRGSKSSVPKGGRWIPQINKPAATQKGSEPKKTESTTVKPKPKSQSAPATPPKASTPTSPKPKPKPVERRPSTQDLF